MSKDDVALTRRDNNFDVLRLFAATLVIVSHAAALSGDVEPAVPWTHDTLGFDGVLIFFAISGLLITRSWSTDPRFFAFAWKRALRILPGLFVACVITAYVIVPIFTNMSLRDYFLNSSPLKYVATNTMLLTNHELHGAFPDNPQGAPNGSLGTLPVEVKAYAILACVGMALVVGRRSYKAVFLGGALALLAASPFVGIASASKVVHLFAVFAGASALYLLRDRVPLRLALFLLSVAVWVASYSVPYPAMLLLQSWSVPYLVYYLGSRGLARLRFLTKPGDLSYGLYIYAFPVSQGVVAVLAPERNVLVVAIVSFAITYVLAFFSWRLIERPALGMKRFYAKPSSRQEPQVSPHGSPTIERILTPRLPGVDATPGEAASG